jgi:predicted GIY-YIG superfamily endonuclease
MENDGIIYLIHFDEAFKHARHYMGFTQDLEKRFNAHIMGDGSALLRAVVESGITFRVVRTWAGDRNLERKLKNRKESPFLCPICNPKAKERAENEKP